MSKTTLEKVILCAHAAMGKRAANPMILEVSKYTSYADYFLIVSASSDRRVRSIAEAVMEAMGEIGQKLLGVEGLRDGRWVLLDFGAFVVHVFYEELRPQFDLEGLWSDAPRLPIPPAPKKPKNGEDAQP